MDSSTDTLYGRIAVAYVYNCIQMAEYKLN